MCKLEKEIEKKFVGDLRRLKCLVYKFNSRGNAGVPDRIVITESGKVFFVELKRENGILSHRQEYQIKKLRNHNQMVTVLYGEKDADKFVRFIKNLEGYNL